MHFSCTYTLQSYSELQKTVFIAANSSHSCLVQALSLEIAFTIFRVDFAEVRKWLTKTRDFPGFEKHVFRVFLHFASSIADPIFQHTSLIKGSTSMLLKNCKKTTSRFFGLENIEDKLTPPVICRATTLFPVHSSFFQHQNCLIQK